MPYAHSGPAWVEITAEPASRLIAGVGTKMVGAIDPVTGEMTYTPAADDLHVPFGWVPTDAECAAFGVRLIVETHEPTDAVVLGVALQDVDGAPTRVWQTRPFTADELKAQVQDRKNQALAAMQYALGGQTYTVTLSPIDQLDVQTQLQLLSAQPAGSTINWEIVANTFLTWQLADLQALQAGGVAHVQAVYARAKELVAQIDAAGDPAALAAIDVSAGWPA